MISTFALSLSLVAATPSQDPAMAHSTPAPATAALDVDLGYLAVFTIAQGVLRAGDPRQAQIAAVKPALQTRIDGFLAAGLRDEGQFFIDYQSAVNARRGTFETELPACLEREAAQP